MRRPVPLVAFMAAVVLGPGSPLRGDQPKSVDCLQVFIGGSDSVMTQSQPPIRLRKVHLLLKNICSVDITAFYLKTDIKSPVVWQRGHGEDMVYLLAHDSPLYNKIPLAGQDFPYDFVFFDDPTGESPFEGTIKVAALAFRDVTAVGDASWVKRTIEARKFALTNFRDQLDLLAKVAHLSDAKALLQGDPDSSLNAPLQSFWREIQGNVGKDPARWAAYVDRRAREMQAFISILKEHSELRREEN